LRHGCGYGFGSLARAGAAFDTLVNFNLTVNGPLPSGEALRLFLLTPTNKGGQNLLFCAPNAPPIPQNPIFPRQGGGKAYSIGSFTPAGTKGSYRYERVSAAGVITVLNQGTWVSPLAEAQQVTFHVTYDAGGLPDAAMAPKADRPEGMLRALGVLMLLVAATVLIGTAGRKRELWRPGAGRSIGRQ
jgi:hypothetical protein